MFVPVNPSPDISPFVGLIVPPVNVPPLSCPCDALPLVMVFVAKSATSSTVPFADTGRAAADAGADAVMYCPLYVICCGAVGAGMAYVVASPVSAIVMEVTLVGGVISSPLPRVKIVILA